MKHEESDSDHSSGPSLTERNINAYEQTMKVFKDTVEKYLLN